MPPTASFFQAFQVAQYSLSWREWNCAHSAVFWCCGINCSTSSQCQNFLSATLLIPVESCFCLLTIVMWSKTSGHSFLRPGEFSKSMESLSSLTTWGEMNHNLDLATLCFIELTFSVYHRSLYKIQEKQGAFKMVRCLTKKHLWPTNFEKMNVGRAVAIFSPQVQYLSRGYNNWYFMSWVLYHCAHEWTTIYNVLMSSMFLR